MSEPLHTAHWYRVSGLRPALRPHLRLVGHRYRGEPWYVLHDPASGRNWRFPAAAERVIALMDGRRTVEEIWTLAGSTGDEMPTQGEIVRLLAQLHAADALAVDVAPDLRELLQREERLRARDRTRRFGNPLAVRTRLFDPDAFLGRTLARVRPLFGAWGALAWCVAVGWGLVLAAMHWQALGASLSDLALAPSSLAVALLIYPAIKAVHELAHAYAVKARGGEVHEIGIMWLLLVPVPYVDASAAAVFADRRARMLVSGAGILAEAFIAAVAMIVWVSVEAGMVRAAAYQVMLVAGVSTLLFNGNPLLRYDGYYVLADLLEIPNLAGRANAYAGALFRRWVLGLPPAGQGVVPPAERCWLLGYALASFAYRQLVLVAIVLLVAVWSRPLALVVGAWYVASQLLYPAVRALQRLLDDPELQSARGRTLARGAAAAVALLALAAVPMPLTTSAEGVMWLPEQGEVRAGTDGELVRWLAAPGSAVRAGQPLAELDDPVVAVRLATAEAEWRAAEARHLAARATDDVEAAAAAVQLQRARTVYEAALERAEARVVESPANGRFVVARPEDRPGRFYRQGDVVGYVVAPDRGTVLAVVDQDDIGLIKTRNRGVRVRLSDDTATAHRATVARLTPGGDFTLPSAALSTLAGGTVAVAPDDPSGRRSLTRVFRVELLLDRPFERLGGRAFVRFDHGYEALAVRGLRRLRQLFLRHLDA